MKNTKSTTELLDKALAELQAMTPEEVQAKSKKLGIPVLTKTVPIPKGDDFRIDLGGQFPEATNTD